MKQKRQRSWRHGFTLVEALAVVAIMVILLAVSAVGVAYYARWLKIAELDNAAREIYFAAEGRAVLLSGSSRLEYLVKERGTGMTVTLASGPEGVQTAPGYYIYHSGGREMGELLPLGTVDPVLLEGSFYIVYEPEGGSVTDVFYAEEGLGDVGDFQAFYQDVSTSARSRRMRMEPMVGYYGGGTAENARDDALGAPIVTIKNEESLTAEITYTVFPSMADKAQLDVTLAYGGTSISLDKGNAAREEKDGRVRFTYTILLDSLGDGKHFYDLFQYKVDAPSSYGGDFTVTATLTAQGATPSSGSDTDNSLFAEGSGGGTAYIANLRHLQNLDAGTSRAGGKKKAVQTADIDCGTYLGVEYGFTPIRDSGLESYDGAEHMLRGLRAKAAGDAGLFASVDGMKLQNIRMVNACVEGAGYVGALAGHAKDAAFDNCWVYWEPEAGAAGLRGLLGDNEQGYRYQVAGGSAGGLAGLLDGGNIQNCLAATLVQGGDAAGGLAGEVRGAAAVADSYADCYLTGERVGGLAGTAGALTLQNCYAAGFIETDGWAAGLCTGGTVAGNAVYSVMRHSGAQTDWTPLAPGMSGENYYYLSSAAAGGSDGYAKTYAEMTANGFAAELGAAFGRKDRDSHPYNLRTDLALTVYDFPGLSALPHYGDWSAQFVEASLVYYEQYGQDAYGFYGGGVDALQDGQPVKDGYAIAIRQEGPAQDSLTAAINGTSHTLGDLFTVMGEDGTVYRLAPLPDELVNAKDTSEAFYLPLRFTLGNETHDYYYCPHFAKAAVKAGTMPPPPAGVSVRTPRHLYMLSLHPAYYHGRYVFHQELDLDYAKYTGYGLFPAGSTQVPIGRFDEPFNGLYDGGCHTIENLVFQTQVGTTRAYAGLFGYSTGTLRNIVYLMDPGRQDTVSLGNHNDLYLGGLAGGNAGSIVNCAAAGVSLRGNAYTATIHIGGLVGLNQGEIANCEAECAALSADTSSYASAYVGGLVGMNQSGGIVSSSYAVGRASAEADTTSGARVCGFVGYNQGLVWNSYAAMDLASSGRAVETYGFCGVTDGTQSGNCFLNKGNFTYRNVSYNASYTPRKAAEIDYAGLTDRTASPVAGMDFVKAGGSPYPTAVKDAAGQPVHYGQWPEQMQLGVMGVYYWEKLEIAGAPTYHVSLLAADPNEQTVTKQVTLSAAHSDNGVVTDHGYGYYAQQESAVSLTAREIWYSTDGGEGSPFRAENEAEAGDANGVLAELMPGYEFHCYHSFGMEADGGGLYPTGSPNGAFTLRQGGISVTFAVNPHFADALSVLSLPQGWVLAGGASGDAPGSTQGNAYEVRAVPQLQNINWNSTNCDTGTVIEGGWQEEKETVEETWVTYNVDQLYYKGKYNYDYVLIDGIYVEVTKRNGEWGRWVEEKKTEVVEHPGNIGQFPYLSRSKDTGKYYWRQTHDLKGTADAPFSPIAEYYDRTTDNQGKLYGWFGGTYDGDDYVIENIRIRGHESSCAGLFGVVYNGRLKSIILYSSDKSGEVSSTPGSTGSCWYAIGTLAGIAASDSGSAVENCAVAGYTVRVDMQLLTGKWGGAEIGGLVGLTNMDLKNCTAVTEIKISKEAKTGNDNMRVGGLVGASQLLKDGAEGIANCYAGGSIYLDPGAGDQIKGIYIGGIVGGSYFKPLDPQGGTRIGVVGGDAGKPLNEQENTTNNALTNCYSYVALPSAGGKIRALYALGGTGEIVAAGTGKYNDAANHGICTIQNCYYLDRVKPAAAGGIKTDTGQAGVTAVSYAELAGDGLIDKLNQGEGGPFARVTSTTDDGFSVSGKYSYPSEQYLQGLNYPFPTILTRQGSYHVHYGDWPFNGIKREDGGAPIELDLFTAGGVHTETLGLDGVAPGGEWGAQSGDGTVAVAECTDGKLTVTGTGVGVTTLTVAYTTGGVRHTLALSVNVTAVLELHTADSPVRLFTNDTAGVQLMAFGKGGAPLDPGELGLTVAASVGVYDSALLKEAAADGALTLKLATGDVEGSTTVNLNYTYTYRGVDHTGMSAITFQIAGPEIKKDGDGATLLIFAGGEVTAAKVTGGGLDEGKVSFGEKDDTVRLDMKDVPPETAVTVEVAVTVAGREHLVTVAVPAEEPGENTGS